MTIAERSDRNAVVGGGYRPYLDGLRVVAVYLVVLFHSGADRVVGGFVGVDVFFVLSGLLVTRLLVRDLVGSGRVGLGRFYARRFRRLLPAAFVVLVVSAVVFSSLASPVEVAAAEGGFRAAFLYWTNWYFIGESAEYFGADLATSPVLQFWSLAVEEQFYLVWPLLLGALWAVGGRFGANRVRVVQGLVVTGGVVSLVWALSLRGDDPVRAYYGTDARAYQLLAGAFLALTPGVITRAARFTRTNQALAVAGLVGLGVVASSWVGWDPIERGLAATVVTVVVLVALEAAPGGPARAVLSLGPVVYLGKVSYGTYLWHWPVLWVMDRTMELSTAATIALTVLIATALASLSFQLLEHPVRISAVLDAHRRPVIAAGLAISVISGLLVIPAINNRATTTADTPDTNPTTTGFTPIPAIDFEAVRRDFPTPSSCLDQPASACTYVEGEGPHILLIGDSHARMMLPAFTAIAEANDLTLSAAGRAGCPWQRDLATPPLDLFGTPLRIEDCVEQRDDVYDRVIPELDPDVIVVMNLGYEVPGQFTSYRSLDNESFPNGSAELNALVGDATVESLDQLRAGDRRVVILEPIPIASADRNPLECLSQETVLEACSYVTDPRPTSLESLYRDLDANDDRTWSADLDGLVCPFLPICDPIVNDAVVKLDESHLTSTFAESLAPAITEFLVSNGIIPG